MHAVEFLKTPGFYSLFLCFCYSSGDAQVRRVTISIEIRKERFEWMNQEDLDVGLALIGYGLL